MQQIAFSTKKQVGNPLLSEAVLTDTFSLKSTTKNTKTKQ